MYKSISIVVFFLSIFSTPLVAADAQIIFCNKSDSTFRFAVVREYGVLGETEWRVGGWTEVLADRCASTKIRNSRWGGFAFSVGAGSNFQSFQFGLNRDINPENYEKPHIQNVCVSTDGSEFYQSSLSEAAVSRGCPSVNAGTQVRNIPVSFWVHPGFSRQDSSIRLDVANVPSLGEPEVTEEAASTAEDFHINEWSDYLASCVPDLVETYARTREEAAFSCTCFAISAKLNLSQELISYEYPYYYEGEYEDLPEDQRRALRSDRYTCTGSSRKRPNADLLELVSKFESDVMEANFPSQDIDLTRGTFLGITAYENGSGPLDVLLATNSRIPSLKAGDRIRSALSYGELRNLSDLREAVQQRLDAGESDIILSVRAKSGGFYRLTVPLQ